MKTSSIKFTKKEDNNIKAHIVKHYQCLKISEIVITDASWKHHMLKHADTLPDLSNACSDNLNEKFKAEISTEGHNPCVLSSVAY